MIHLPLRQKMTDLVSLMKPQNRVQKKTTDLVFFEPLPDSNTSSEDDEGFGFFEPLAAPAASEEPPADKPDKTTKAVQPKKRKIKQRLLKKINVKLLQQKPNPRILRLPLYGLIPRKLIS